MDDIPRDIQDNWQKQREITSALELQNAQIRILSLLTLDQALTWNKLVYDVQYLKRRMN